MKSLLEKEVPSDRPGIIAYDDYWKTICANPSFRSLPEVRDVMKCSRVLEDRVKNAFTRPAYKPTALRLIEGLSIHRLTTGDIYAPVGATAVELRDHLCLFEPMIAEMGGDEPEKDLLTHVETVLGEIHKTVNGQFISSNQDNGQYYLDLNKVDDFDALIEKRAESLDDVQLDRHYYAALRRVMECSDTTYATDYKIWHHEVEWQKRRAARTGYLFFGAPNERSTAVPERDFYLYFIQPHDPPRFSDGKNADEVFFRLRNPDEEFTYNLRNYAAAVDLSQTSSGYAKKTYHGKAEIFLRKLAAWLRKHFSDAFEVTYQGSTKLTSKWLKGKSIRSLSVSGNQDSINFRDFVNAIASACLDSHFSDQAPDYPTFSIMISNDNRAQTAQSALTAIAGTRAKATKQALAVLDALQLLDGDQIDTENSIYADHIKNVISKKGHGQVTNRTEIISDVGGLEYMDPGVQRLEPEWVIVALAAMVHAGDVVLAIPGKKYDATSLQALAATPIRDLIDFKHLEQPKDWNLVGLKALFELFKLPAGYVNLITQGKADPLQQLQAEVSKTIERILKVQQTFQESITFWGEDLLSGSPSQQIEMLKTAKDFLESLQRYNTPGKLKNFHGTAKDVQLHQTAFNLMQGMESLQVEIVQLSPLASWLYRAEAFMPAESDWVERVRLLHDEIVDCARKASAEEFKAKSRDHLTRMDALKKEYIRNYIQLHQKARLGVEDDQRKAILINDRRVKTLKMLVGIDLMPNQQLTDFQNKLAGLQSCFALTEQELQRDPNCPHCKLKPADESSQPASDIVLDSLDEGLDNILQNWTETLLDNLEDPFTMENIELLDPAEKQEVLTFIQERELPAPISHAFVQALREILSGLEKIVLDIRKLSQVMQTGSGAATPDEMKKRFSDYIDELSKGKDRSKVRIVVEDSYE